MAYGSRRITGNVSVGDIQAALVSAGADIGGIILDAVSRGSINKWAKWKPLKSTVKDLPTVDDRMTCGRASADDFGLVYGVRGGIGQYGSILALHSSAFAYECCPDGTAGECYRLADFVHPTDTTRGYYADAVFNLRGEAVSGGTAGRIYIGAQSALLVDMYYDPSPDQDALSVEDFLTDGDTVYDPLDCYPCILISTATGYSYIHCLYPSGTTACTRLGDHAQGYYGASWALDLSDGTAVPEELQRDGIEWTWTVFLAYCPSGTRLVTGNACTDISGWVESTSNPDSPSGGVDFSSTSALFDAWMANVADVTGLVWTARTSDLPDFDVTDVTDVRESNGFYVSGTWDADYASETVTTITVELYDDEGRTTPNIPPAASSSRTLSSITVSGRIRPAMLHLFTWDEFGLVQLPQQKTYYARVSGKVTDTASQEFTTTVSDEYTVTMYPVYSSST